MFTLEDKKVLGALDVVVSLKETDQAIRVYEERIICPCDHKLSCDFRDHRHLSLSVC